MGRATIIVLAPVSREEALAEEEALNNTQHFQRVVLPTTKKYKRILERWRNFHIYRSEDPNTCLQRGAGVPSAGKLKMFMKYLFTSSVGLLTEHVTLKSLKNSWYSFRTAYQRETYSSISEDVGKDVVCYITTVLREMGLAIVQRQKQMADQLDIAWLLTFLWCYDKYEFRHPRQRTSLSFILLFLVYTGMRAGSVVESSAYPGSNEALCYKDFELIGLPRSDGGGIELVLKVRFRFEKGRRAENKDDESGKKKWVTFYEDTSCRGRCPITHFLGHAFADGVFEALEKPSNLQHLRISKHQKSMPFEIKASKRDTPIFRRCERDGTISADRAMTYRDLREQLGALGYRAGLRDLLKTYNIRRGTANAIDGNVSISANQYAQLLGHAVKTMGAFYISDISAIDTQGIVNGEVPRDDHIAQLRGMSLNINLLAPDDLPFLENQAILDNQELVLLLRNEDLSRKAIHAASGDASELRLEYEKVLKKRKTLYNKLCSKAKQTFRQRYFSTANTEEIRKQVQDGERGTSLHLEPERPLVVKRLQFISASHFGDRYVIANVFWTLSVHDTIKCLEAVVCMSNLCNQERFVLYYSGQAPVSGSCPVCDMAMSGIHYEGRAKHIHACFLKKKKQILKKEFDSARPSRCMWDNCTSKFLAKAKHLPAGFGKDAPECQGFKIARKTESKRLLDQRQKSGEAESFIPGPRKSIAMHLTKHFSNATHCLWDGCRRKCESEFDLRRHLFETHQLYTRQAEFQPQFCYEHPTCGWFMNEFEWEDHCKTHLTVLPVDCSLQKAHGTVISGIQCPFCLGKEWDLASHRIKQFKDIGTFNRHVEFHKAKLPKKPMACPIPGCDPALIDDYNQLQIHFSDVHQLKPKGFAKSRGFIATAGRVKRKLESSASSNNYNLSEEEDFVENMCEEGADHTEAEEDDDEEEGGSGWEDTDEEGANWEDTDDDHVHVEKEGSKRKSEDRSPLSKRRRVFF